MNNMPKAISANNGASEVKFGDLTAVRMVNAMMMFLWR